MFECVCISKHKYGMEKGKWKKHNKKGKRSTRVRFESRKEEGKKTFFLKEKKQQKKVD